MDRKKVAVLFGGCSPEYKVSLSSAVSVIDHLDRHKYEPILIGITEAGNWFRYYGGTEKISNDTWWSGNDCIKAAISPDRDIQGILEWDEYSIQTTRIDVAFPVLHGKNGEDGSVQSLLQLAGIPYVGCDTLSSAICMDKDIAHTIARNAGVKTPRSAAISRTLGISQAEKAASHLKYPIFVKPAKSGSSYGITKIHSSVELHSAISQALEYDDKVIIEEGIEGCEVGCAVVGNDNLFIGEVDEIELKSGFLDFKEKYVDRTATIHLPARISPETAAKIKSTAELLYKALGCSGFARVDMFLTPNNDVVFNEINTIPGFTSQSRYPKMLESAGLSYSEILDRLIELAKKH